MSHLIPATCALIFIFCYPSLSQVGIGAFGVYQYPGLQSSGEYNIRFDAGVGYGFYVKHDILRLENSKLFLRYLAKITNHQANLPGAISTGRDSEYSFSNLSLDVLYEFFVKETNKYYTGLSVNFLRTLSEGKFRDNYTGSAVYPSLSLGWERKLFEGFDALAELRLGYGKTDKAGGPEEIPVTGLSLLIGITMYISE